MTVNKNWGIDDVNLDDVLLMVNQSFCIVDG
jgi:hypothetical protein